MLSYLSSGLSMREILFSLLVSIPVIIFALSFHEAAHAFVAWKMGDPTARNMGRLTLDPLKHLDPVGTLVMVLFGFGWAKPVPINTRYFKKPKKGMALTALAGPLSNLLLAFASALIYGVLYYFGVFDKWLISGNITETVPIFLSFLAYTLLVNSFTLNTYLAVFNLLPVPPFDGSRIAFVILPDKWYFAVMKYERIIMIVLLALMWTGVFSMPLNWLSNMIMNGIIKIVNMFLGLLSLIF